MKKRALFLDRDGVINKTPAKHDYVKNWSEFHFIPKIENLIAFANKMGLLVIVVTNQRGVAKNLMSKKALEEIHQKMCEELKEKGAVIDKVFCCTHDYKDNCDCRKPKPGLLFMAAQELNIGLSKSLVIGDSQTDVQAAMAAGCPFLLVKSNQKISLRQIKAFMGK